jgi:hypothetical protein
LRQVAVAGAAVYLAQLPAMGLGAVVWSGRRGLVAAGAAAAVTAAVSFTVINQAWDLMVVLADFVGPPVVVFLLFARRTERPPLSLLWLPGLALGVALAESLASAVPALFAAVTAGTTLLSPYTTGLSLVTVLVAACWLATDIRPLASLVFAFTVSRVVYGFAYGRPLVTVGPAVITLGIAVSLVTACALAWLLRRRIRASPPMTSTPFR